MFTLQLENLTIQRKESLYAQTSNLSQTKNPRKDGSQTKDYATPRMDGSQTKDYSTPRKDCSTPPKKLSTKKKDVYDLDFTESRFYLIQFYYIRSKSY